MAGIPIFVFLSPGVDVAASVEALGRKLGFTADNGRYAVVSLGQGQEPIAMAQLTQARAAGGWVLLQNIHLTIDWTAGPLEKAVDKLAVGGHPDFRRARRPACGCMRYPVTALSARRAGSSCRRSRRRCWSARCPSRCCRTPSSSPTSRPRASRCSHLHHPCMHCSCH